MSSIVAYWNSDFKNYKIKFRTKENSQGTFITLDTGAGVSVLGLNVLINEGLMSISDSSDIYTLFTVMNIKPKIFYSATNTKMPAYPCFISDVYLSGVYIEKFYFYMFLGRDNPNVALLGNDFIRFCSISKSIDSDIKLSDFDFDLYERNFLQDSGNDIAFPISSIYDELERIESTKDIASAFRYLITHPRQ